MLKTMLFAAKIAILATPLMAQSASGQSPSAGPAYTSFIVKVPYAFDLPAKFKTARINCSIRDATQTAPGLWISAYVDLVRSSSGEVIIGYDEGGDTRFSDGGQLEPDAVGVMRDMISSDLFELNVTCETGALLSGDDQEYRIVQLDGGRWGSVPGNDRTAPPAAWMTDDYEPQVSRTFNQSENEAFGAFDPGTISKAVSGQATIPQSDGNGLSSLDSLLKP